MIIDLKMIRQISLTLMYTYISPAQIVEQRRGLNRSTSDPRFSYRYIRTSPELLLVSAAQSLSTIAAHSPVISGSIPPLQDTMFAHQARGQSVVHIVPHTTFLWVVFSPPIF